MARVSHAVAGFDQSRNRMCVMGWDFETDPEFQSELDWIENFVREEIEPLDFIVKNPYDLTDPTRTPAQGRDRFRARLFCTNRTVIRMSSENVALDAMMRLTSSP